VTNDRKKTMVSLSKTPVQNHSPPLLNLKMRELTAPRYTITKRHSRGRSRIASRKASKMIQYLNHDLGKVDPHIPILQIRGNAERIVRISPDQSFWRTVLLHWDPEQKKSVPHCDTDCPLCPLPYRMVTYTPCLLYDGKSSNWLIRILAVNESMRGILAEDIQNAAFILARSNGKNNSPITYRIYRHQLVPQHFETVRGFEIEPSLLIAWGKRRIPIANSEPAT